MRRHGVFGGEFEYTDRLAKLHENQAADEVARYELDEDDEYGDEYGDEDGYGSDRDRGYRDRE